MPKTFIKIVVIFILFATALTLSWVVYSNNSSNRDIPRSAKLVKNIIYNVPQGGINYDKSSGICSTRT